MVLQLQGRIENLYLSQKSLEQDANALRSTQPALLSRAGRPGLAMRLLLRYVPRFRHRYNVRLIRGCGLFDAQWYLRTYSDVQEAGQDPAVHFLNSGAAEMRNPGPYFDTEHYLGLYPDIAGNGMNPLLHYLAVGFDEGRHHAPRGSLDMPPVSRVSPAAANWKLAQRLVYVVSHSYPYSSDDYAVRTHEVARALGNLGHEVIVLSRPGRSRDIEGFPSDASVRAEQVIDGVRYVFLPGASGPGMNRRARLRQTERVLLEAFEIFRPGAVLAVSNWENGEPAQFAARRWGAAFFYEQRGFPEMVRADSDPDYENSKDYGRDRDNEARVARSARAVFTLNRAMGEELERRGVPEDKIHLVPNGVSDPGPVAKGVDRASIGCTARHLLGYVGSLSSHEGGGEVIDLLARLRGDGVDVDLMIVGSGAAKGLIGSTDGAPPEDQLKAQAAGLGIAAHIHFVPLVAQDRIGTYYSMLDAIIMPHHRTPASDLVAPLKPYAAAAYGVPVFMTDMAPLDEVARDIHASLFPEGDIGALAEMVRHTLEHGGHPAVLNPLPPGVRWQRRVRPMSRLLKAAGEAVGEAVADLPGTPAPTAGLFDTHILPRVALHTSLGTGPVAALGPCAHLGPDVQITRLTRVNILAELATGTVGRFMIDWAGLQGDRTKSDAEWDGLWLTDNMRLNRQVMDACRIALDRGWRLQVVGPVLRARAPLFRTVSGVIEEILPSTGGVTEGTTKETTEGASNGTRRAARQAGAAQ